MEEIWKNIPHVKGKLAMRRLQNAYKLIMDAAPPKAKKKRVLYVSKGAYTAAKKAIKNNEPGFSMKGDKMIFLNAQIVRFKR